MKTLFILAVVIAAGAFTFSDAQSDSRTIPFDTISVEEAEKTINSLEGQQHYWDFAAGALQSKRADLITVCFKNQYTAGWLRDQVIKLPDSSFKDDIVLMMLRSVSPFWPPDEIIQGSRPLSGIIREPFLSVTKRHLPTTVFADSLILTHAARLKLADDLKAAIAKEKSTRGAEKRETVTPTASIGPTPAATGSSPEMITKSTPNPVAVMKPDVRAQARGMIFAVSIGVIIILLGIVGLSLLMKKKKS